jgi:hypothetical protein
VIIFQIPRDSRLSAFAEINCQRMSGAWFPQEVERLTSRGYSVLGGGAQQVVCGGEQSGPCTGRKLVPGAAKIRLTEMGHIGRHEHADFETGCGPSDDAPSLVLERKIT